MERDRDATEIRKVRMNGKKTRDGKLVLQRGVQINISNSSIILKDRV